MILILTDEFDTHANAVIEKLKNQNINYYRLNLNVEALKYTHITFRNNSWSIKSRTGVISQDEISCVWCRRPFVELTLQENIAQDNDFKIWKSEWNQTLLGLYNSIKHVPWLNPLRKAYKGENKYYQMELAHEIGLLLPETLVSNSKDEITAFVEKHNGALMKLMSQEIYRVGDEYKGFYTNMVYPKDLEKFNITGENPLVFQNYIEKAYEVRYTVVSENSYVCRIDSQKSERASKDWRRYDIPHTPHSAIEAPKEISEKVSLLMKRLGLEYGAIDFIVNPSGRWYFLEINCFGQWLWIEQLSGLPISDGIVEWLKNKEEK